MPIPDSVHPLFGGKCAARRKGEIAVNSAPSAHDRNFRSLSRATFSAVVAIVIAFLGLTLVQGSANAAPPTDKSVAPAVGIAHDPSSGGYWIAAADGGVFSYGGALSYGSMAGHPLNGPIVGIAASPTGHGYWLVASDGGVFTLGDAKSFGSMGGQHLNAPVVGIASTPTGKGYWLVASDGGIFAFGDAQFRGSMGGQRLNAPVVGIAATGSGYWLAAADGGIFAFPTGAGGQPFYGSMGGKPLNAPVVGISATPSGHGYWMVAADGGVFNFGDAPLPGSMGGQRLASPVVGMTPTRSGKGYWLVASDGGIFAFGDAVYAGRIVYTGPSGTGSTIVGDIFADSSAVPCAAGTTDVGLADGYHSNTLTKIRLCAVPNLSSSSEESTPGSRFYISGASGRAIVNSRVSGAVLAMVNAAKGASIGVSATSTFRTMAHQQSLWNADPNPADVAPPGTSNHQMGLAIDFVMPQIKGGKTCAARATQPNNATWKWLSTNAIKWGYRQYSAESWHWDPTTASNMC